MINDPNKRKGLVPIKHLCAWALVVGAAAGLMGCGAKTHRLNVERVGYDLIAQNQKKVLGQSEAFTVALPSERLRRRLLGEQNLAVSGPASWGVDALAPIDHWPEPDNQTVLKQTGRSGVGQAARYAWERQVSREPIPISLTRAMAIAARYGHQYQTRKEALFNTALSLDSAIQGFRNTYTGMIETILTSNDANGDRQANWNASTSQSWQRRLKTGATLGSRIVLDLANLLTSRRNGTFGLQGDLSITMPLLRGAGRHIVTEPLTQAERNMVYAIWQFERFKRQFIVDVIRQYLSVLQSWDRMTNEAVNYERRVVSLQRSEWMVRAGRQSQVAMDQARQSVLRAKTSMIASKANYENALDRFKVFLGLPVDAHIALDRSVLTKLSERSKKQLALSIERVLKAQEGEANDLADKTDAAAVQKGPWELNQRVAIERALAYRLDLRIAHQQVYDAQRQVVVVADALKMGLALTGGASLGGRYDLSGGADQPLRLDQGDYRLGLSLDLPWERHSQGQAYWRAHQALQNQVRHVQGLEDQIKMNIRQQLQALERARENIQNAILSHHLAQRRVESSELFLQAGKAQMRDLLESQDALVQANNATTSALVEYHLTELALQRDMEQLDVQRALGEINQRMDEDKEGVDHE